MIFRVIRDHLTPEFAVADCCRVLGVSVSGYYRWKKRPIGVRETREADLLAHVRSAHEASRGLYGAPRVRAALVHRGVVRDRKTIARIMRKNRLRSRAARRWRPRTTDSNHAHAVAPNTLDRAFSAVAAPDHVWLADITYIATGEGFVYLACVLDLFSRRIVGWSMADSLRGELTVEALTMAIARREPKPGLLHHSDRGTQYCAGAYRSLLASRGMVASMSRAGDCHDNAPMESFWSTLKKELTMGKAFATRAAARLAVFEYVEAFYNRKRLHSGIGYLSPEAFEAGRR